MARGLADRIFIITVALAMTLVPIRFYFHLDEGYLRAMEFGMLLSPWEMRVWLLIEVASIGCFFAAVLGSRKAYWAALCLASA